MSPRPAGHHGEKPSETQVRFVVENALGVRVCCYDDRSGKSRPDAIVHRNGGVPLEIVSDPHKPDVQLLGALDKIGSRAQFDGLACGYRVCLTAKVRVNDLDWLERALRQLEDPDPERRELVPQRSDTYMFICRDAHLAAGEVRLTSGSGGSHPIPNPPDVVTAATAVLAQSAYDDVARKLDAYGGNERHAVLMVDEEQDFTFNWLRQATPADVNGLPAPELAPEITHLWVTSRYTFSLTIAWSEQTGWQGTRWTWGDPIEALTAWDDPECPDDHTPGANTQAWAGSCR